MRGYIECRFGIRGEREGMCRRLDILYLTLHMWHFTFSHWTGSTLDFTVYTIESIPLHFILYKLYFTFLALHCTPDTPQEQETMGFSTLMGFHRFC